MGKKDKAKKRTGISSNARLVGLVLTLLILGLEARLYKVMVVDNSFAAEMARQQIYRQVIYDSGYEFKGDIYDRNMKKLTNDSKDYRAVIDTEIIWRKLPDKMNEYKYLLGLISELSGNMSYEQMLDKIEEEYNSSKKAIVMVINDRVRTEIVEAGLPGIYAIKENRKYGDNVGASITMNFINNKIGSEDIKYDDSIDMTVFNQTSRYVNKVLKVPVDAKGDTLQGLPQLLEESGTGIKGETRDIVLTVDYSMQKNTEEALQELCDGNAAATIIDIKTGEILAMASKGEDFLERNMVNYHYNNNAYNPGSVFKIVVLAAALEEGVVDMGTKFFCIGRHSSTGIACHKADGHGLLGLEDAFAYSCNVYFIELAKKVGAEKIISMAQRFGFGSKVLNFSRESKGKLYINWKDINYDIGNIAIGQKDINVTPLQVCDMIATIANNGIRKKTNIIKSILNSDGSIYQDYASIYKENRKYVISESSAKIIEKLLRQVVERGSGQKAEISPGAAGKTGTPERGPLVSPGRHKYEDSWFAGYFPADNPRYAITVFVEDMGPEYTIRIPASSVFKAIAEKIISEER